MSTALNIVGMIYLDQRGMLVYTSELASVLQLVFQPDVVQDLEVLNKESLQETVARFMQSNNISPFKAIILLSQNLLFEKEFQTPLTPEQQQDVDRFLDNVPFENTATIIFENEHSRIIATNKDLYQSIAKAYESSGCIIEYVFPDYILGIDLNQAFAMNKDILYDMFRRAPQMKQYSYILEGPIRKQATKIAGLENIPKQDNNYAVSNAPKQNNKRVFILLGIFVALLIVLAVVVATSLNPI